MNAMAIKIVEINKPPPPPPAGAGPFFQKYIIIKIHKLAVL